MLKNSDHPYHTADMEASKQAAKIFGIELEIISANMQNTNSKHP